MLVSPNSFDLGDVLVVVPVVVNGFVVVPVVVNGVVMDAEAAVASVSAHVR